MQTIGQGLADRYITIRPTSPRAGVTVSIGFDEVTLFPEGGPTGDVHRTATALRQLRSAVSQVVDDGIREDRRRRRWSWLPGYVRICWGEDDKDPGFGKVYKNGRDSDLAATEIVTVFGLGYCRYDRMEFDENGNPSRHLGTGTTWGFFRFVPAEKTPRTSYAGNGTGR